MNSAGTRLEGVADGEMEGQGFLKARKIKVAALARVIGSMDTNTQVGSHY